METKKKAPILSWVMYVAAGILAILFIWMFVNSITYISNYAAQYGMPVSGMMTEAIQYVLSNSVMYLVYALVMLALAQILKAVSVAKDAKAVSEDAEAATEEAKAAEYETGADAVRPAGWYPTIMR